MGLSQKPQKNSAFTWQCACRESSPGHKHGRLVCCHYTTGASGCLLIQDLAGAHRCGVAGELLARSVCCLSMSRKGSWCSGITPAQHAGAPGLNPLTVHKVHGRECENDQCTVGSASVRQNLAKISHATTQLSCESWITFTTRQSFQAALLQIFYF